MVGIVGYFARRLDSLNFVTSPELQVECHSYYPPLVSLPLYVLYVRNINPTTSAQRSFTESFNAMSHYAAAHQNPQGPGDARPTALQIIEDENLIGKLVGKTIFITGANQGIGLDSARALYATGADVFLGVRSNEKGDKAIADIRKTPNLPGRGSLQAVVLSLDSLDSVRKGVESFLAKSEGKLNILVNNAGVIQHEKTKTVDGFESHFGTNHVGHFLLFQLLRPALLASVTPEFHSRVVAVSSMAHRASEIRFHDFNFEEEGSFEQSVAYGHSKTANIYFQTRLRGDIAPKVSTRCLCIPDLL